MKLLGLSAVLVMAGLCACSSSGDDGGPCQTTCNGTVLTASETINSTMLDNATLMLCREMDCASGQLGTAPGDGEQVTLTLQDCWHVVLTVLGGNESWAFAPVSGSSCDQTPTDGEEYRFFVAKLGGMTLFQGSAIAMDMQSTLCDGTTCHSFNIDMQEQ